MAVKGKVSSLPEVVSLLKDRLIELRERFGVRRIGVFGSFAEGKQNESSDVDILVEVEPARTAFDLVRLSDYLSELLGRKIDLVTPPAIRREIADHVFKEVVEVRDPLLYLMDALESVEKILEYTEGMSFEEFIGDEKTRDAVERRFQILDEAVKKIPPELKRKYPQVPWKEVTFGIDYARVWNLIKRELPQLRILLSNILQEERK